MTRKEKFNAIVEFLPSLISEEMFDKALKDIAKDLATEEVEEKIANKILKKRGKILKPNELKILKFQLVNKIYLTVYDNLLNYLYKYRVNLENELDFNLEGFLQKTIEEMECFTNSYFIDL